MLITVETKVVITNDDDGADPTTEVACRESFEGVLTLSDLLLLIKCVHEMTIERSSVLAPTVGLST